MNDFDNLLNSISSVLEDNPVIIVSASTGSGKSTLIPKYLSEYGKQVVYRFPGQSTIPRIIVSVPTVVSAKLLYKYQSKISPDKSVGYAAEGDIHYNDETSITYVTSGHLERVFYEFFRDGIVDPKGLYIADYIMLDEIHTGTIENSIALGIWSICHRSGVQCPKLILASATVDFSIDNLFNFHIPKLESSFKRYNVTRTYHNRNYKIGEKILYKDVADVINSYHMSGIDGNSNVKSSFLIFAAGKDQIRQITENLKTIEGLVLRPAYSDLSSDELNKITEEVPVGMRKVIIATNIAEASITIENLSLVVDTLRERIQKKTESGSVRLSLEFISKSSANQRCGRTGRDRNGICYRMCTEDFYEREMQDSRKPEIERIPLHNYIIKIRNAGLHPLTVLEPPNPETREQFKNGIKEIMNVKYPRLGLIDWETRKVTPKGNFSTKVPLNIHNSSLLWDWIHTEDHLYPGIVAVSIIDSYGPSYFYFPQRDSGENLSQWKIHYFEKFKGHSDLHTFLNMWLDLLRHFWENHQTISIDDISRNHRSISWWAKENSINAKKIKELVNTIKKTIKQVERMISKSPEYKTKIISAGRFTSNGVVDKIRPLLSKSYFDSTFEHNRGSEYYLIGKKGTRTNITYRLDIRTAINEYRDNPPSRIYGLSIFESDTTKIINMSVDDETKPVKLEVQELGKGKSLIEMARKRTTIKPSVKPTVKPTIKFQASSPVKPTIKSPVKPQSNSPKWRIKWEDRIKNISGKLGMNLKEMQELLL